MAKITPAQFEVVADLLRSRDPVRAAVKKVLLRGVSTKGAAEASGLSSQSVSNALRRYRAAHIRLEKAYALDK
ncbi:MAG: hypothetical protein BroJett021_33330 [Chloroflexota bacterium]|nr:MAG: hypothetical protein BroJett021_33330 [Chloroflexota bacterium]